jgi:hypothetical protein
MSLDHPHAATVDEVFAALASDSRPDDRKLSRTLEVIETTR